MRIHAGLVVALASPPGTAAALVLCSRLQPRLSRAAAAAARQHPPGCTGTLQSLSTSLRPRPALVLAVEVVFFLATRPSEPARAEDPGFAASTGGFAEQRVAAGNHAAHWSRGCCRPAPGGLLPGAVIGKLLLALHSSCFPWDLALL